MIHIFLVVIAGYWTWKGIDHFLVGIAALRRTGLAVEDTLQKAMLFSLGAAVLFRYLAASSS